MTMNRRVNRREFILLSGSLIAATMILGCNGSSNDSQTERSLVVLNNKKIFRDSAGRMYEVFSDRNTVLLKDDNGQPVRRFGTLWKVDDVHDEAFMQTHLSWPTKIIGIDDESIAILDKGFARVVHYDINGTFLFEFTGSNSVKLIAPGDLVYHKSVVYVSDSSNHHIFKYDAKTGDVLGVFGSFGTTGSSLNYPTALAVDWDDNIHVADTGNNRIAVFNDAFEFMGSYSHNYHYPNALLVDNEQKTIYVARMSEGALDKLNSCYALNETITLQTTSGEKAQPLAMQLYQNSLVVMVHSSEQQTTQKAVS
jgi:hypothetical protein